jgi:hypothetical protein
MKISVYSKIRIMESADQWRVPREYFDPLFNYLVHGFNPGGFWTAVLANDFMGAIQRSHPANQIEALKHAAGWIAGEFPRESFGDYSTIAAWEQTPEEDRRKILEDRKMIYTEKEEVELALRGVKAAPEPMLFG